MMSARSVLVMVVLLAIVLPDDSEASFKSDRRRCLATNAMARKYIYLAARAVRPCSAKLDQYLQKLLQSDDSNVSQLPRRASH